MIPQLCQIKFSHRVLSWLQTHPNSQDLLSSALLANWYSDTDNRTLLIVTITTIITYYYYYLLLLLLLLLLLTFSPKAFSTWRYFNPGSQVAVRRMLSEWAHVQSSTVGQCENYEDNQETSVVSSDLPA